jgi:NADPH:quinone reductase-like Zn-dependent oxidoreductase
MRAVTITRHGERLLVHAAAGGVGVAVLQLCRAIGGIAAFGTASPREHDLIALDRSGAVRPHLESVFSFADAADAHRHVQPRKNVRKVLLKP